MQIFRINTIPTGSVTNLWQKHNFVKEFWELTSLQLSPRRELAQSISADRRVASSFHKLLNNHLDVVLLCCDLDLESAIVDAIVGDGHDVRSTQPSWMVNAFVPSAETNRPWCLIRIFTIVYSLSQYYNEERCGHTHTPKNK